MEPLEKKVRTLIPADNHKMIAAQTIARTIDPEMSFAQGVDAFSNPALCDHPLAPFIHTALATRAYYRLTRMLAQQIPHQITIDHMDPDEPWPPAFNPQKLNKTVAPGNPGLYLRAFDGWLGAAQPLFIGQATFDPDPLAAEAPNHFLQVYHCGTIGYRDKTNEFRIWDIKTGACINDGKAVLAKLRKEFGNGNFFVLQGISRDNSIAWIRAINRGHHKTLPDECAYAFNIHTNKLLGCFVDNIAEVSHSGQKCLFYSGALLEANSPLKTPAVSWHMQGDPRALWIGISPTDEHALIRIIEGAEKRTYHSVNLQTGNRVRLFSEADGITIADENTNAQWSPDGRYFAVRMLMQERAYIYDVVTGEQVAEIDCSDRDPDEDESDSEIVFSPDSSQLYIFIEGRERNLLRIFDLAQNACIAEVPMKKAAHHPYNFIFCNNGRYLLLPSGDLIIQPAGLAAHLSLKQLLGLLLWEHSNNCDISKSLHTAIIKNMREISSPKIKEIISHYFNTSTGAPAK